MNNDRSIAYFSMEVAVMNEVPTYSGGLGILAGDTIRSGADLNIPMIAVTLLYRHGYFYQKLDDDGNQSEEAVRWDVEDHLVAMEEKVTVRIEGRDVEVGLFRYDVRGQGGYTVPVYFLDTDLPNNDDYHRKLTHNLYGGDKRYRLCQEVVLGIGGMKMLRRLGYSQNQIRRFHMNEGHASLLTLELLNEQMEDNEGTSIPPNILEAVRQKCVFTTHTPVPAGHDRFPMDLVKQVLDYHPAFDMPQVFCCEGELNMTYLALNLSHYTNGVAKKHAEVSRKILTPKHDFAHYTIDSITNGVHARTWISPPFRNLFDAYIPGWREDSFNLRYACGIPREEIWQAHVKAKRLLIDIVNRRTNIGLDADIFTLGYARRATAYKRPDLIFLDIDRLQKIVNDQGPIQIVYAGKSHPGDENGKALIRNIFQRIDQLKDVIKVVYLDNYDMAMASLFTSGSDIWLNTPEPPMEASGTSGMKAALNGVPSLSILDGWWIEGCIEGKTGWSIGENQEIESAADSRSRDAHSLYDKLEKDILPAFYNDRELFTDIMMHAIALNGSFFNTQRMMQQYMTQAYQ